MTYKIEKNIPMVKDRFPFSQMEIGDSFLVDDGTLKGSLYQTANRAKVRIATKSEGNGYRVWLTGKIEQ